MNIPVRCRTNLDKSKNEKWPDSFPCRPMIGDRVQAESGVSLKIYGITFAKLNRDRFASLPETILIVELNK